MPSFIRRSKFTKRIVPSSSWAHRHHVLSASPFTAMSTKTFLSLLALLLLRTQLFGQESVIRAHCIGVHDGDTITILVKGSQQLRIRLAWIDAPELGQAF